MAPRHSPLACPETLLEEVDNPSVYSNQETALVTTTLHFHHMERFTRVEGVFMYPALPFFPSIFDNNFQRGLPPVTHLYEGGSQPLESDSEAEESDGDSHPPESDDESDKENQDPNGRSHTRAIAVAREGQLPREEDYFDARVVTELEELGNTWRQFMGGALRAPQPHSPSITELYSEPH